MVSDGQNIEQQIVKQFCNFLVASNIYTKLSNYRKKYNKIDPIIFDGNVAYVSEFREGYLIKKFFIDSLKQENLLLEAKLLMEQILKEWQKFTCYCIMAIEHERSMSEKKQED